MWKSLLNTDHFILYLNNFDVTVTDCISVWHVQYTEESFLACLKESNAGLEMSDDNLVKKGTQMLANPDGLKRVHYEKDENHYIVTMTMSIGCPLRLQMRMTEGSKEMFYNKVTQVLLKCIQDLRASQCELREELLKKDKEIDRYKCEGGEIALRFLKTIPFNDELHVSRHTVYTENFGSEDVFGSIMKRIVEIPEKRVIKTEPSVGVNETAPLSEPTSSTKNEVSIKKEEVKEEQDAASNGDIGESARTVSRSLLHVAGPRRRPGTAHSPGKKKRLNL